MRSSIPILICCLYALSAVDATPFSKAGNAEVQQGNVKAAEPQQLWSEDKGDDDDEEDKGGHNGDECATRSVSILIGSSTYAIPCLGAGSIVNLNGLLADALPSVFPSPSPSSSVASSSAVSSSAASSSAASSSDVSSSGVSSSDASTTSDTTTTTTTTTDTTTTTTTTDTTTTDTTTTDTTTTTTTTTATTP
ncbi:hypothetical protein K450DRAFT_240695 [Umbelopsis ramanniana AG]|uniref:Uncharacterized protein n=1 Tax=Umbelopsis ramanniana AG TaxID=1314678 RepID=A0AAD5EAQ9_UMBRA|nr:uncharacterized protein K450DRAFT_240695 [Umbelopsis ramanniana AG]KAI8579867.1 hypothetical protein K450DRAFT_240695 [Umbelopsis ramanniana AG]